MAKKPYNINNITMMETIPGSIERTLRKGDEIFVSLNDRAYIEALLKKHDKVYNITVSPLEIVQFTLS